MIIWCVKGADHKWAATVVGTTIGVMMGIDKRFAFLRLVVPSTIISSECWLRATTITVHSKVDLLWNIYDRVFEIEFSVSEMGESQKLAALLQGSFMCLVSLMASSFGGRYPHLPIPYTQAWSFQSSSRTTSLASPLWLYHSHFWYHSHDCECIQGSFAGLQLICWNTSFGCYQMPIIWVWCEFTCTGELFCLAIP